MKDTVKIKMILALACVSACAFFFLHSCGNTGEMDPAGSVEEPGDEILLTAEQVRGSGIEFGELDRKLLSHDIATKGKLFIPPRNIASIGVLAGGTVEKILVTEGDFVKKGEALATFTSPEIIRIQQEYISTENRLHHLQQVYERQQVLNEKKINAEKDLEEAEYEYLDMKAQHDADAIQVRMLNIPPDILKEGKIQPFASIVSPIAGTVEKVEVNLGQFIEPGQSLFLVIDRELLYIELMVFEKDIPFIRTGQRVTFTLSNLGGEEYEARVRSIGRMVEENARTVKVLAEFTNRSDFVLPGMFVAAEIHTDEQTVDALPEEAVVTEDDGSSYIFIAQVKDGGKSYGFLKVPVTTGFREEGYLQVTPLQPLPEGSRIAVKGTYFIRAEAFRKKE